MTCNRTSLWAVALFLVSFLPISLFAQVKLNKISKSELEMTSCSFYEEATSMILGTKADLNFIYHDDKGWQYKYDLVIRKKIFKLTDSEEANFRLKLYEPVKGHNREEVKQVKAMTYNLVNGKIKKTKLSKSERYEKRLNDYWVEHSYAMPDVKDGSVIEIRYSIISDYIHNLRTWTFQEEIPVAYSEFRYLIPQFFDYQIAQLGGAIEVTQDRGKRDEDFSFSYQDPTSHGSVPQKAFFSSESNYIEMIAENIIPVQEEPYMNNKGDLPSRVEFQLISIKLPRRPIEYVAGNYETFNQELYTSKRFGGLLDGAPFVHTALEECKEESPIEKAAYLLQSIQNQFSWNEFHGIFATKTHRELGKNPEGNIADLNLALVASWRAAGLDAFPVILSTRGNGTPHPVYPNYEHFDYVVGMFLVGDDIYFGDASSGLPLNMLPPRCLNGQGFAVSKSKGIWVDLQKSMSYKERVLIQVNIDEEEEEIQCSVDLKESGYAAHKHLKKLAQEGEEGYWEYIQSDFEEWQFKENVLEEKSLTEGVVIHLDMVREVEDPDLMYLNPLAGLAVTENPFKRKKRSSMVDYPYGRDQKLVAQFDLPEGYTIELPESSKISLPDNAASFTYRAMQNGQKVTLISHFKINKLNFTPAEYEQIQTFYQMAADKNNEMIVLKKI